MRRPLVYALLLAALIALVLLFFSRTDFRGASREVKMDAGAPAPSEAAPGKLPPAASGEEAEPVVRNKQR
jgi:hypothetical protein